MTQAVTSRTTLYNSNEHLLQRPIHEKTLPVVDGLLTAAGRVARRTTVPYLPKEEDLQANTVTQHSTEQGVSLRVIESVLPLIIHGVDHEM